MAMSVSASQKAKAQRKERLMGVSDRKSTDGVLVFLGSLIFLGFLLLSMSLRFQDFFVLHGLHELCHAGCREPWRRLMKCPQ